MDSSDENTGEVVAEKSLESGCYHHQKPSNNHQHHRQQFCTKYSIKILLSFIVAALSCFILYQSWSYNFGNSFISSFHSSLPTSDGQTRHGNQPNHSLTEPSSPTNSIHRNTSYSATSDNSSPLNNSPPADFFQWDHSSPVVHQNGEKELDNILKRAATKNKTVILTTLNSAWIAPNSILDLFLESFRIGDQTKDLLNHLVVVALDKKAYSRCLELHPHCYALTTEGIDFSGEAYFMTADYLKMMWRRIDFLRIVLDMGYNFIFTDADVMWFRNPFIHFYSDTDFQIACDHYWYASTDLDNSPNGGFNFVQSNNRTVQFYTFWYNSKDKYPGKHDQDVLNFIKYDPFIKEIGLSIRFLDTAYFGGFCEPSKDLNQVCTMHANCCIGLENKIHDLKMLIADWRNYMVMTNELRTSNPPPSWTVPRICG